MRGWYNGKISVDIGEKEVPVSVKLFRRIAVNRSQI